MRRSDHNFANTGYLCRDDAHQHRGRQSKTATGHVAHHALEWPHKLDEMSARAGLDLRQRRLIEKYLVVMAER